MIKIVGSAMLVLGLIGCSNVDNSKCNNKDAMIALADARFGVTKKAADALKTKGKATYTVHGSGESFKMKATLEDNKLSFDSDFAGTSEYSDFKTLEDDKDVLTCSAKEKNIHGGEVAAEYEIKFTLKNTKSGVVAEVLR